MMKEVTCDDGNGESTFEFVEGKIEGLTIDDDNTRTSFTTAATTTSGIERTEPMLTPSQPPQHQQLPPQASTNTTSLFSSPLTSTIPLSTSSPHPRADQPLPVAPSHFSTPGQASAPPLASSFPRNVPFGNPSHQMQYRAAGPMTTGVVQNQPVTMYAVPPPDPSTAIELPLMEQSAYPVSSPTGSIDNKSGFLGWIKDTVSGSDFLTKVAEKAKNSMDSVITTLDPQMKQYIYSGGDIDVIVASDKEANIGGVREAFQAVFGRASINGIASQTNLALQPVGFAAGLQAADQRIDYLRRSGYVNEQQPILAVNNLLVELTPERWYSMDCLLLRDMARNIVLHSYTLPLPIPPRAVIQAQEETPQDYPLRWSGLAVPIGKVVASLFQVPQVSWREALSATTRKDLMLQAAKVLAMQYKHALYNQL